MMVIGSDECDGIYKRIVILELMRVGKKSKSYRVVAYCTPSRLNHPNSRDYRHTSMLAEYTRLWPYGK